VQRTIGFNLLTASTKINATIISASPNPLKKVNQIPLSRDNFADLVDEIRASFDSSSNAYLLTAAVPAAGFRITEGYDVPRISKSLDLLNIMSYDMRGAWDNAADHHAPMNNREHDRFAFNGFNTAAVMRTWHQGRRSDKFEHVKFQCRLYFSLQT
jgi:GH18 family chitinase